MKHPTRFRRKRPLRQRLMMGGKILAATVMCVVFLSPVFLLVAAVSNWISTGQPLF